jgi:glycosyltransferase involved in cell wall biosynthesis
MAQQVSATIQVGDYIEKWYGTTPTKVIYGAVEPVPLQWLKRRPKAHHIVFVGRLEPDTGIRAYLAAFERLNAQGQSFTATICGDGSLRAELGQLVERYQLPVTFTGMVANPLEHMAEAEVVCVAGYLAIIEAASLVRPIVAYFDNPLKCDYLRLMPIADQLQIVDNEEAIAEALLTALNGQIDQRQLSLAAQWAKDQTWSAVVDTYLEIYQQFI